MTTPKQLIKQSTVKPIKRAVKPKPKPKPTNTRLKLDLNKLREVASITHSVKEIAVIMGCAESTLHNNKEYKKIIEDARITIKHSLKTQVINLAFAGDQKCLFYCLNNYTEFSDKKTVEVENVIKPPTLEDMFKKYNN